MKRSLIVAAAVLAMLAASLSFTSGASAGNPTITPKVGHYEGRDTHHRHIRFYYNHHQVSNFSVGHHHIGDAPVKHGGWHDVCNHGFCFNGGWVDNAQVHGSWRVDSSSHHTGWHASLQHAGGGETH